MLDRLQSMQVFVQAARRGSLSAAGRALGLSPAMAGRHLDALERRLGVRLMHRTTRRLTLTDAGTDYLETCQRLLPALEDAEASIASQGRQVRGPLRVTVPLSYGLKRLAPLMPAFQQRYPALQVSLEFTDARRDLLEGSLDLAVRVGTLPDSRYRARRLDDCRLRLCAAPAYLDRRGTPRHLADLIQHNCLLYDNGQPDHSLWTFSEGRQVRVQGDYRTNNGDALAMAAVAGQGIVYEPDFIVDPWLESGALVTLPMEVPPLTLGGVHALYPGDHPPARVRAFIDFLVEQLTPAATGSAPATGVP